MATVLHDLVQDRTDRATLKEVQRTLKPGGRLAVIEFKKIEGPPGPPMKIRISPKALETYLKPFKLVLAKTVDMGEQLYLSVYHRS